MGVNYCSHFWVCLFHVGLSVWLSAYVLHVVMMCYSCYVVCYLQGRFECNDIHNNKLAGVWIKNYASPLFRKNDIHHGRDVGFFIFQDGQVEGRGRGLGLFAFVNNTVTNVISLLHYL